MDAKEDAIKEEIKLQCHATDATATALEGWQVLLGPAKDLTVLTNVE